MNPHRLCPSLKLIAVVFLSNLVHSMLQDVDLSDECLSCICQATTGCNMSAGCTGDVCGPYWITKPYWEDAGKPTTLNDSPDDEGAFERCSDDSICAAQTVRGYMYKFRQDCNGDAVITCLDYAKIHRQGAYGCYGPLDDPFKSKLEPCLKDIGEWYSVMDRNANQQHTEISDSECC